MPEGQDTDSLEDQSRPVGRPSAYTQEIADELCARIAEGASLRRACASEDMPSKSSVFKWLRERKEFADQYRVAVHERTEDDVEDIRDIADDSSRDYIQTENGPVLNSEHIQRSKLRVDARKWIASKRLPKQYGERIEHTGEISLSLSDRMRGAVTGATDVGAAKAE